MRDISGIIRKYKERYPRGIYAENELMSDHTTFRIGGPVRVMFFPQGGDELIFTAGLLRDADMPFMVVGNGSNLLFSDAEHDIAVINTGKMSDISIAGTEITAGAGCLLGKVSAFALEHGLSGMEFAGGIPASVGGAVFMNAGAYGGEIKDVLRRVTAMGSDLKVKVYSASECGLSYRSSRFQSSGETVLSAELELKEGDRNEISGTMQELARRRREKQPLTLPSAGSFFKRPEGGFAAAMIDEAGLKGLTVGGAQVSAKHAGFVVNAGGATFDDVIALMEKVQSEVYKRTGVMLEPEVRIIR